MRKANLSKLHQAVKWAAKLHRGQDRDGAYPLPYLTHPLEVLGRLRYQAGVVDEDQLCAAVLHDVVELCDATVADVETRFGPRVAALVGELTRREPDAAVTAGLSTEEVWHLRSNLLLDEIRAMSPDARRIKLADRVSNLGEGLRTRSGEKLRRYVEQSYLIIEVVPREVSPPLWDDIKGTLDDARLA